MSFDSTVWKTQRGLDSGSANPRAAMLPVLQRDILKPGVTRDRVQDLLGPPDRSREGVDYYDLGRSTFGPSDEELAVEYRDDALLRAWLVRT